MVWGSYVDYRPRKIMTLRQPGISHGPDELLLLWLRFSCSNDSNLLEDSQDAPARDCRTLSTSPPIQSPALEQCQASTPPCVNSNRNVYIRNKNYDYIRENTSQYLVEKRLDDISMFIQGHDLIDGLGRFEGKGCFKVLQSPQDQPTRPSPQ